MLHYSEPVEEDSYPIALVLRIKHLMIIKVFLKLTILVVGIGTTNEDLLKFTKALWQLKQIFIKFSKKFKKFAFISRLKNKSW